MVAIRELYLNLLPSEKQVYQITLSNLPWVPEVFFSFGATELSGEAARASREAARKKPLAPTDNNLTSIPTPVSFDWHPQSELILETQQAGFYTRGVKYACRVSCLRFTIHCALSSARNLQIFPLNLSFAPQTSTSHLINYRIFRKVRANCENLQRCRFASWVKVSQL